MFNRLISENLRKPSGIVGWLVGRMMARGNVTEAAWSVALLDIQPDDHVLEVGFGPGVAIQHAAKKATAGRVAGIDYSEMMVRVASRRNAAAIRAGRVELQRGDVAALPFPDAAFDKAYAIHSIYFWPQPLAALKELRRVLKPGGQLAMTIMPRDKWSEGRTPPSDLFTLYSGEELARLVAEAGFTAVHLEKFPEPDQFPGLSVLAQK
jgi:ubiquinone/menaquinone biosynthesis C-methylase UbiE